MGRLNTTKGTIGGKLECDAHQAAFRLASTAKRDSATGLPAVSLKEQIFQEQSLREGLLAAMSQV